MKKSGCCLVYLLLIAVFSISFASSVPCNLGVNLINQDPYPAIPGDYVKVIFQIDSISNPECGLIKFEIKEGFPFSLDPDTTNPISIRGGAYEKGYGTFYIAPYKIRVDGDALDGENPIEVRISTGGTELSKEFNINIDDVRVDFEVFVKNYDSATNIMTFEILNVGENDVEAVTVEIPTQDNVALKGPNKNIIGDLDSNEYTTADFEATSDGGNINLVISYTDAINTRRTIEKTIIYEPSYFTGRKSDKAGIGTGTLIVIAVLAIVGLWLYRRWRKKRRHRLH